MKYRVQTSVLFPKSSGMATWCKDQMDVRYDQAVHLKEGEKNEEQKKNKVVEIDADNERFICDLPLLDQDHAQDAFNILTDDSVWFYAIGADNEEDVGSYVNLHKCGHDEMPQIPCEDIDNKQK